MQQSGKVEGMKHIDTLKPDQIIAAIRKNDLQVIRQLVHDGVTVRKIWTVTELAEMLNRDKGTISRWSKGIK